MGQIVRHVVNHGNHHRDQVAGVVRQLGGRPLGTGLIGFQRAGGG